MKTKLCFLFCCAYLLPGASDSSEKYENCEIIWLLTAIVSIGPVIE